MNRSQVCYCIQLLQLSIQASASRKSILRKKLSSSEIVSSSKAITEEIRCFAERRGKEFTVLLFACRSVRKLRARRASLSNRVEPIRHLIGSVVANPPVGSRGWFPRANLISELLLSRDTGCASGDTVVAGEVTVPTVPVPCHCASLRYLYQSIQGCYHRSGYSLLLTEFLQDTEYGRCVIRITGYEY